MEVTTCSWDRTTAGRIAGNVTNMFPSFDPGKLAPLMPGYHVWDSWFIMTEDGKVADFQGSRVLIALVRPLEASDQERIAYFVSTPQGFVARGFLFPRKIYDDVREWSGSTILRDDGRIQTFYTIATGAQLDGVWQTNQRFATAIQPFSFDQEGLFTVEGPEYHELLAEPDGELYETWQQAVDKELTMPNMHSVKRGSNQSDNFCFRDPKFFKDPCTKECYILFEGNTGPKSGSPGGRVHQKYLGTHVSTDFPVTPDDLKANGCVGVLHLTNPNYSFGTFKRPWLVTNLVTDEIERINVMVIEGAYYLFVAGHGNKNSMITVNPDLMNVDYMLGFRAHSFLGNLVPLNGSGVVVYQKSMGEMFSGQDQNQQYTYSWMLVPTADPELFECISYANFCNDGGSIKPTKTSGPSLTIKVKKYHTVIVDKVYSVLPAPDPLKIKPPCKCS